MLYFTAKWGILVPVFPTCYGKYNDGGMYVVQGKHREARETCPEDATIGLRHEEYERILSAPKW